MGWTRAMAREKARRLGPATVGHVESSSPASAPAWPATSKTLLQACGVEPKRFFKDRWSNCSWPTQRAISPTCQGAGRREAMEDRLLWTLGTSGMAAPSLSALARVNHVASKTAPGCISGRDPRWSRGSSASASPHATRLYADPGLPSRHLKSLSGSWP